MDLSHNAPFPTVLLPIQVNEASKLIKRHKQRCATSREGARTLHGPALSSVISGQGRSPTTTSAHHSHAATEPCPRPQSRHRGRPPAAAARGRVLQGCAPRSHVQSRVQKQKAHSRAEHWSFPRAPQAQDKASRQEESKIASKAARNKRKKPAFANKCNAHRAYRCGVIAERDKRLCSFYRTTAQRKTGSEVAVALKASSAVWHLRRVRHAKTGPVETRRRGTSTTHISHQHTSWANSEVSRGARAQGRPTNRKSEKTNHNTKPPKP